MGVSSIFFGALIRPSEKEIVKEDVIDLHGVPPIFGIEGVEIESVWSVVVRDGCEGQAVGPRRRKVFDFDSFVTSSLLLAPSQQRRLDRRRRRGG